MDRNRRKEIVECARDLFEEQGLAKTSVRNITDRIGVTRTLFYHYFPDRDALVLAVLDSYVEDFLEALNIWNEGRRKGDVEDALDGVVRLLRTVVFENGSFRRALASNENASLYIEFLNRVAENLSRAFIETTMANGALKGSGIVYVEETFYVLIVGISGYMRSHPDADDEMLKDIIAQTLHLNRTKS